VVLPHLGAFHHDLVRFRVPVTGDFEKFWAVEGDGENGGEGNEPSVILKT
jgi:hypothetical protein